MEGRFLHLSQFQNTWNHWNQPWKKPVLVMKKLVKKPVFFCGFFHEHTGNESDIFSYTFLHHFFRSHTMEWQSLQLTSAAIKEHYSSWSTPIINSFSTSQSTFSTVINNAFVELAIYRLHFRKWVNNSLLNSTNNCTFLSLSLRFFNADFLSQRS